MNQLNTPTCRHCRYFEESFPFWDMHINRCAKTGELDMNNLTPCKYFNPTRTGQLIIKLSNVKVELK
jgi:hypothetical protein